MERSFRASDYIDSEGAARVDREHPDRKCRFRIAALCPVAIECEHGYDVCPQCDPCTCAKVPA